MNINLKLNVKKTLIVETLQVETFPNIKQQLGIDVDATCIASISKKIFIFSFLKKCSVTLCFKLLRPYDNFRHKGKLFQIVGVKKDNVFWPEHMLFDGCFNFK